MGWILCVSASLDTLLIERETYISLWSMFELDWCCLLCEEESYPPEVSLCFLWNFPLLWHLGHIKMKKIDMQALVLGDRWPAMRNLVLQVPILHSVPRVHSCWWSATPSPLEIMLIVTCILLTSHAPGAVSWPPAALFIVVHWGRITHSLPTGLVLIVVNEDPARTSTVSSLGAWP